MRAALLIVLAALTSCISPDTSSCGDLICPHNTTCSPAHGSCVSDEAIAACSGLDNATECIFSRGEGQCSDGVCIPFSCGDGVVKDLEECDGDNVANQTCASVGFYHDGPLHCTADCTFDVRDCRGVCGDDIVEGAEACDGEVTTTCAQLGFYKDNGPVTCTPLCTLNASTCSERCGDGAINGPEFCDGAPPVEQCTSFGFDYGSSSCTGNCAASLERCGRLGWKADPADLPFSFFGARSLAVIDRVTYAGAGGGGMVRRFTARAPLPAIDIPAESGSVTGLWGTAGDHLFAITDTGKIYRFDGTQWALEIATGVILHAIHGASPTSAWAVGDGGAIFVYDGQTWTADATSGTTTSLRGVFALGATDVIAVGLGGVVIRFDGTSWIDQQSGVTANLTNVWASGPNDVYVGGEATLLHWDGTWTTPPVPLEVAEFGASNIAFVAGTSASNVFVIQTHGSGGFQDPFADHAFHFDGTSWIELAGADHGVGIQAVAIGSTGDVVYVGPQAIISSRAIAIRWHAGGLQAVSPDVPSVNSIATVGRTLLLGAGSASSIFSSRATLVVYDGTTWSTKVAQGAGFFNTVWAADPTRIFLGFSFGVMSYDATTDKFANDTGPTTFGVASLWGASATDVYAAGFDGVFHRDASGWSLALAGHFRRVFGLSSTDVYAMGDDGIFHYDGISWQPFSDVQGSGLWASSGSDIYVPVGSGLKHFDGVAWSDIDLGLTSSIRDISGSGPHDVFVVADGNLVLHYDGVRWAPVDTGVDGSTGDLGSIYADGSQWIVGGFLGLGAGPPGLMRQYLRTGPGGLGKQ